MDQPSTITSSVGQIQAATEAYTNAPEKVDKKDLNSREDFLNMLVVQLKNQDPLNPLEGQEFSVQLAQFSQVEGLLNINETLQQNSDSNDQVSMLLNNIMTTTLLGKDVQTETDQFRHEQGEQEILQFNLAQNARSVEVTIMNANGTPIETLDMGSKPAGDQSIAWDGVDGNGNEYGTGDYLYSIKALDAVDEEIETVTFGRGRVTGVKMINGMSLLTVNGQQVPASSIREILEPMGE